MPSSPPLKIQFIALTILFLMPGFFSSMGTYDEGIPLVGAQRILAGELPYRDFWSLYPAGLSYFIAALSGISGISLILSLRIIDLATRVLLCALSVNYMATFLPKDQRNTVEQGFIWIVSVMMVASFPIQGYNALPALALCLSSFYLYRRNSYTSGLAMVLLALIRIDFFLYGIASYFLFFLLEYLFKDKPYVEMIKLSFATTATLLSIILLILCTDLPFFLVEQLLITPLHIFSSVRYIPYPTLGDIIGAPTLQEQCVSSMFYIVPALFLGYAIYGITRIRRDIDIFIEKKLFLYLFFGSALLNQAAVRSDFIHLIPSLFILMIVSLSLINSRKCLKKNQYERLRQAQLLSLLILTISYGYQRFPLMMSQISHCANKALTYEQCLLWKQPERSKIVSFVKQHSDKQEKIVIVSDNNDTVIMNDVALYALSERLPASKYHELHPGVATAPSAQLMIIAAIKKKNVKILVEESGTSIREQHHLDQNGPLDTFIDEHYETTYVSGNYTILTKKNLNVDSSNHSTQQ